MYLNLIEVLDNDGFSIDFDRRVNPPDTKFRGEDLIFPDGISLKGYIKNLSGTVEIFANIKGTIKTKCSRCFNDTFYSFSFDYSDEVARHGNSLEGVLLEGSSVNLEDIAYKAVISELPMQILCDENCKGLCPKCGADLNVTTCGCENSETDPRWDILKKLNLKDEV